MLLPFRVSLTLARVQIHIRAEFEYLQLLDQFDFGTVLANSQSAQSTNHYRSGHPNVIRHYGAPL
jgi:hypothetical protein